jgi:cephalosporin-C deacetylase
MDYLNKKRTELEGYLPPLTRRPDFHRFWAETLQAAQANPLRAVRKEVPHPLQGVKVYDIAYCGYDSTPIHGWLLIPETPKREPHPCLVHYHGFTGSRGQPWEFSHWLQAGTAVLSIDCREQGGDTGNHARYSHGMVGNVVCKGLLDPREYYYRAVYMDCVKALDFLETCPELDPKRLVIEGGSQGGALGMAVCALDKRPALAMLDVPSNSNLEARVEGQHGSFSAVFEYLRRFPDQMAQAYETLSYFDTMNMAESITCPLFASVGLLDNVCPAKCYFASYNRIQANKTICLYPFNGHEGGGALHTTRKLECLAKWLKDQAT